MVRTIAAVLLGAGTIASDTLDPAPVARYGAREISILDGFGALGVESLAPASNGLWIHRHHVAASAIMLALLLY